MARTPTEGEAVTLRLLLPEDWRAYREIRLRSLATDPTAFEASLREEAAFPAERWKDRLTRPSTATWAGVVSNNSLVGTIAVAEIDSRWYILGMWVDPASRGRGVAGRLLDEAIAWVRSRSPSATIYLDVNPRQEVAARLYRSRRFEPSGRSKALIHSPGEIAIEMILEPSLGSP